jgi:CRISPR-associated protein (TIGR02584 family)
MKTTKTTPRDERPNATPDRNAPPDAFRRRILLAVTGLSPQVVTETLYALVHSKPAFVPTEIHLLTTADGAKRARLTLLSEDPGWFHRLRKDYGLPDIKFDASTIHAIKASDIRTRIENEELADALTDIIRKMTSDKDCALHVSIAGGRKTMGFYAGYALSLFGRAQDRLSHVLVSEPYESNTEFFYPTPYSKTIYTRDEEPLDTREAEIGLADIPFVRFGKDFDDRLRQGKVTFSQAVAAAQRALDPPLLEIDLDEKCINAGGQRVRVSRVPLAFLSWLARRRARAGGRGLSEGWSAGLGLSTRVL